LITTTCARTLRKRPRSAGDAGRSAVEVPIEKYEKTAMQWLQEQTLSN